MHNKTHPRFGPAPDAPEAATGLVEDARQLGVEYVLPTVDLRFTTLRAIAQGLAQQQWHPQRDPTGLDLREPLGDDDAGRGFDQSEV